jgi:hypothetical protein
VTVGPLPRASVVLAALSAPHGGSTSGVENAVNVRMFEGQAEPVRKVVKRQRIRLARLGGIGRDAILMLVQLS